jgi:hypothetical protein
MRLLLALLLATLAHAETVQITPVPSRCELFSPDICDETARAGFWITVHGGERYLLRVVIESATGITFATWHMAEWTKGDSAGVFIPRGKRLTDLGRIRAVWVFKDSGVDGLTLTFLGRVVDPKLNEQLQLDGEKEVFRKP